MKRIMAMLLCLIVVWACCQAEEGGSNGMDDALAEYFAGDTEGLAAFIENFSIVDDTLIIREGVTALGGCPEEEWVDDESLEDGGYYAPVNPEYAQYFDDSWDFESYFYPPFSRISFPSTLKALGIEAFVGEHFQEFTLPKSLQVLFQYAIYACTFDVLRIETELPAEVIFKALDSCTVYAYEVPEDHPLYKAVDGVLFSKDGKTLIRYPNGRTSAHYDVPAGVERIESGAFSEAEALENVSLPIGLKSVGDYAFSGCDLLRTAVLPLTVREIGKDIFYGCVSLELVSLPQGLSAGRDESQWAPVYYANDAIFRGDNGDTYEAENQENEYNYRYIGIHGRIREDAALYNQWDSAEPFGSLAKGTMVYIERWEGTRVKLSPPYAQTQALGWVNISQVDYLPENSLFFYEGGLLPKGIRFWRGHVPGKLELISSQSPFAKLPEILAEDEAIESHWAFEQYGSFLIFGEDYYGTNIRVFLIQDAHLTRRPDGTADEYGFVFNDDPYQDVQLFSKAGGDVIKELPGGTQVKILGAEDGGYLVFDGLDQGWAPEGQVRIVLAGE